MYMASDGRSGKFVIGRIQRDRIDGVLMLLLDAKAFGTEFQLSSRWFRFPLCRGGAEWFISGASFAGTRRGVWCWLDDLDTWIVVVPGFGAALSP